MILIELNYKVELPTVEQHTAEHRAWLDEQYQKGLFLLSGPKNPRTGGFILALGNDKLQLEQLIQQDPFYKKQIADYTFTEFITNKCNPLLKDLLS